jgi:hypothetical protein
MKPDQRAVNHTGTREIYLDLEGPPLSTRELAYLTGMSPTFIRKEIRAKEVKATVMGRGRKRVFRIVRPEARRYLRQLGLLDENSVNA